MKPVAFDGYNITFAKDQPQYLPLPAYRAEDGTVVTQWKLTWKERLKMLITGHFWVTQLTFNNLLQPIRPSVETPLTENK